MQVIDRVVSVPRDTTQEGRVVSCRVYTRRRWDIGTWVPTVPATAEEWESLIVAAIAGLGHGKVGRGFETWTKKYRRWDVG